MRRPPRLHLIDLLSSPSQVLLLFTLSRPSHLDLLAFPSTTTSRFLLARERPPTPALLPRVLLGPRSATLLGRSVVGAEEGRIRSRRRSSSREIRRKSSPNRLRRSNRSRWRFAPGSRLLLGLEREQDQAPADPRPSFPQTSATTPTPRPNDSSLPTASPSPLPDRTTSLPLPLPEQSDPISKTLSGALSLAQSTAERRRSRQPKRSVLSLRTTPSPQRTSSPSSPINQQGRPVNPTTTTSSPSSILDLPHPFQPTLFQHRDDLLHLPNNQLPSRCSRSSVSGDRRLGRLPRWRRRVER